MPWFSRAVWFVVPSLLLLWQPAWSSAADYVLQSVAEPAPADAVPPEIAAQLQPTGVKVMRGGTRTVCEIWFCKQWPAKAGFSATASVLYPFEVGELLGVIRYKNKGGDFRNQEIPAGVYTIRYGQQPEDGNHVGTSDTRDFLLLLPVAMDTKAARMADPMLLHRASAKAAGGTHPTMLSLLRAAASADASPALHHDEDRDLVSVVVVGQSLAGDKAAKLPLELVVVGHAAE